MSTNHAAVLLVRRINCGEFPVLFLIKSAGNSLFQWKKIEHPHSGYGWRNYQQYRCRCFKRRERILLVCSGFWNLIIKQTALGEVWQTIVARPLCNYQFVAGVISVPYVLLSIVPAWPAASLSTRHIPAARVHHHRAEHAGHLRA